MLDSSGMKMLSERLGSGDISMTTLVDGSGALVDIEGMEILTFNGTGMRIVNRLRQGEATLPELVHAILSDFDVDEATATRDAVDFVRRLESALLGKPRKG